MHSMQIELDDETGWLPQILLFERGNQAPHWHRGRCRVHTVLAGLPFRCIIAKLCLERELSLHEQHSSGGLYGDVAR
jgi:hypothetical protein